VVSVCVKYFLDPGFESGLYRLIILHFLCIKNYMSKEMHLESIGVFYYFTLFSSTCFDSSETSSGRTKCKKKYACIQILSSLECVANSCAGQSRKMCTHLSVLQSSNFEQYWNCVRKIFCRV